MQCRHRLVTPSCDDAFGNVNQAARAVWTRLHSAVFGCLSDLELARRRLRAHGHLGSSWHQTLQTLLQLARGDDPRPVESMDVLTKQLSREETRLPHPINMRTLRARVEELVPLVFDLMETRFDEAFEWPTNVRLIIKFRSESGRRSKSRALGHHLTEETTLHRIALELLNEFFLQSTSSFVATHVNLCVTDFQPLVTQQEQQSISRKIAAEAIHEQRDHGIQAYFGPSKRMKRDDDD